MMNVLVIAAHPDDEVLGMGGTIKKLSKQGHKIHLCVISEGASAQYSDTDMIKVRHNACLKSGTKLGISSFEFFGFPDARLDSVPQLEINLKLERAIKKFKPNTVYTTPFHDLSKDHLKVFESTLVASRPSHSTVKTVMAYEIPGFTRTPFHPNAYENITNFFKSKVQAFKEYESEVESFPHPRSLESIENLCIQRGIEAGCKRAESFYIVKSIND